MIKAEWEEFGALVRKARVKLNLSQRTLAKSVDKDATTVSRWEKGERRPKQGSLIILSNVLHIKIQTLQALAGYTPEFDWYVSLASKPDSKDDILHSATDGEKERLMHILYISIP